MRPLGYALVLAALSAAPAAAAETRNLSGFDQISASAGMDVVVSAGEGFSVNVDGARPERVVTRVEGRRLIVEPVRSWGFQWGPGPRATVRITMPSVTGLDASSGAEITATGIAAESLSLEASSAGEIRVSGTCRTLQVDASSGAEVHAGDLHCAEGSIDASSGAEAAVWVDGELNVDASSGADINAKGSPTLGDISLSSGGSLHRD